MTDEMQVQGDPGGESVQQPGGLFPQLLKRTNRQLRDDRAGQIATETAKRYRRKIEDLQDEYDRLTVDRDNMLDINPGNTQTIINPSDFNSEEFVDKDIEVGLRMRNLEIQLEIAKKSYSRLFENFKMQ